MISTRSGGRASAHPHYTGKLPTTELTRILATAGGMLGSCADYLRQTVECLFFSDIHDPHLVDLGTEVERMTAASI